MKRILYLAILAFVVFSCNEDTGQDVGESQFGIFRVLANNTTIEMNGEINSNSYTNFKDLLVSHPNTNLINIVECNGSLDDSINLELSRLVHDRQFNIHLLDNGVIASGGVDFFLAGIKRTRGTNTMMGVHAWTDGTNEATDFPEGDPEHQPYLDFYRAIGLTQQEAEDFYYFTINAAPSSEIHYMTDAEIQQYNILKN